jgi:hypothetical protein
MHAKPLDIIRSDHPMVFRVSLVVPNVATLSATHTHTLAATHRQSRACACVRVRACVACA